MVLRPQQPSPLPMPPLEVICVTKARMRAKEEEDGRSSSMVEVFDEHFTAGTP